jgi:hypothetical protein
MMATSPSALADEVVPLAGSLDDYAPYPVPAGRGRWRLTLHSRVFVGGGYGSAGSPWTSTLLAVLTQARSRRIEVELNKGATLTFTVDGRDPIAGAIRELQVDVMAWRWDDWANRDVCVGRFIVDHSEDQISEQAHVVTFGAHDYLAMLDRRHLTGTAALSLTQLDQDQIVELLVKNYGVNAQTVPGVSFLPGSWLPLHVVMVGPTGLPRGASLLRRDRIYQPGAQISALLDDLAHVINGFEYDVLVAPETTGLGLTGPTAGPLPANVDALRIFYPSQGVVRSDVALVYGSNVGSLTRTVSSADYADRVWAVGNKASTDPLAPQRYADQSTSSASSPPAGLWADVLSAPDVSDQSTLNEQTAGLLAFESALTPSYTLTMRPGSYRAGYPNLGDVVGLVVQSGRLDVREDLRVVGIAYDIGDDGEEDIGLTVGRAPTTLGAIFRDTRRTLDALNRK